jgi:hypothetical protein
MGKISKTIELIMGRWHLVVEAKKEEAAQQDQGMSSDDKKGYSQYHKECEKGSGWS